MSLTLIEQKRHNRHVMYPRHKIKLWLTTMLLMASAAMPIPAASEATPIEHVIIISIDGLRPDAISAVRTPNLHQLKEKGAYASDAKTVRPSTTIAAHVSMLTGLDSKRHKITGETFGRGYYRQPTIFSIAKAAGLTTAMFFAKEKLDFLADPAHIDFIYGPQRHRKSPAKISAHTIANAFNEAWSKREYALTLIHLREPDKAGHWWGWMSKPYLKATTKADRAIGHILATVAQASVQERTVILVTADHGGYQGSHREERLETMTIPWILVAPNTPSGIIIDKPTFVYDIAPTVLSFLGLRAPTDMDGQIVGELRINVQAPD